MTELAPWLVAWAVVTTAVLALAFYRLMLGLHVDPESHIEPDYSLQLAAKQTQLRKIARVEFFGQALTLLAIVLILVTAGLELLGALS